MLLRLAFWTVVFGALGWFQATHPDFPIALVPTLAVGLLVLWLWRTGWLLPLIALGFACWVGTVSLFWGFIAATLAGMVFVAMEDRQNDLRIMREARTEEERRAREEFEWRVRDSWCGSHPLWRK